MTDPTLTPEKLEAIGTLIADEINSGRAKLGPIVAYDPAEFTPRGIELHVKVTQVNDQHLNAAADVQRNVSMAAVPCDGEGPNTVLGVPGTPLIHVQLSVREPDLLPLFLQDKRFKLILVPEIEETK